MLALVANAQCEWVSQVSIIQSCSQGINKVVESLHHQFPAIPKSHLRNKVREISDFVDNHWQVSFTSAFST